MIALCGTGARWAARAAGHPRELLLDQAHLEKKAAAAASRLLFRLEPHRKTHLPLSRLAREELLHFERAVRLLHRRGWPFAAQRPCGYAEGLKREVARDMPDRLLDEIVLAAVIEARSLERMALLAGAFRGLDEDLAAFCADLVRAERRRAATYTALAAARWGEAEVERRWDRWVKVESSVLAALPFEPRLHSGCPRECDGD
ncbi:MAG: tRNA isopentenyl-2-thiomethyl-A-37 hydroxylase MiaE [Planctomycetota bacterium]